MNKVYVSILLLFLISILGCRPKPFDSKQDNWDKQNTRGINVNDEAYQQAIKDAKDSLPFFVGQFHTGGANHEEFYVKLRFEEGNKVEHMWLQVISVEKNSIQAVVDNVPEYLTNVKYKDSLWTSVNRVEDWAIYKGDSLLQGDFINKHLDLNKPTNSGL